MNLRGFVIAKRFFAFVASALVFAGCSGGSTAPLPPPVLTAAPVKHVFTIILENQAYNNTFGPQMPVPYLSQTVAAQGASIPNYYGTSHFSLGNYLSLISGQAVTTANQDDCTNLAPGVGSNYVDIASPSLTTYNQVQGKGCIYPAATLTIADQLAAKGLTWKGYMEDMGNDTTREPATCGQPGGGIGAPDNTASAQVPPLYKAGGTQAITDQYAARHNPFVYFHSLLDTGACTSHVVPLNNSTLPNDLASIATTPNYVFITPNLCDDGHDVPCKSPSSPSTYVNENAFLQKWVPMIVHSPAFQQDGLLMITFDESSPSPNAIDGSYVGVRRFGRAATNRPARTRRLPGIAPLALPPVLQHPDHDRQRTAISGGGQIGTVLVSPFTSNRVRSATVGVQPLLRCCIQLEDLLRDRLPRVRRAIPGTTDFGTDVFGHRRRSKYYDPSL